MFPIFQTEVLLEIESRARQHIYYLALTPLILFLLDHRGSPSVEKSCFTQWPIELGTITSTQARVQHPLKLLTMQCSPFPLKREIKWLHYFASAASFGTSGNASDRQGMQNDAKHSVEKNHVANLFC